MPQTAGKPFQCFDFVDTRKRLISSEIRRFLLYLHRKPLLFRKRSSSSMSSARMMMTGPALSRSKEA